LIAVDKVTSWRDGVTPQQMREIDRLAEERYGITSLQLMEVAGLAVARVARRLLPTPVSDRTIAVLAGPGNNGGDGLVAARRLAGWGLNVTVLTAYEPAEARGLSTTQVGSAAAAGVAIRRWDRLASSDLVVDAMLGFGATGAPRQPIAEMIAAANRSGAPILALDVPSGLDAGTGILAEPTVAATATLTLALPKTGLLVPDARPVVGRLFLADIGVPPRLLSDLGVDSAGLFAEDDIIELT
jgi:NAD(P)H-hydrate epimerase